MSQTAGLLEIDGARVAEPGRGEVAGLAVRVAPGELVALEGGHPRSRSLVARAVLGFVPASAGRISVLGVDLSTASFETLCSVRARCALASPSMPLLSNQTVRENVLLPLLVRASSLRPGGDEVEDALDRCQASPLADRRPESLSPDENARVLLARALVVPASLYVLDVPRISPGAAAWLVERAALGAGALILTERRAGFPTPCRVVEMKIDDVL